MSYALLPAVVPYAAMSNSASSSSSSSQGIIPCRAADRSQRRLLQELFDKELLTDVELLMQGERIVAHRVILAAASPFFHALFTSGMKESRAREIELHEVNVMALRELLQYMYLGEIQITGDNILAILHTANQLEMLEVVEICCKQLILELNVANCIDIYVCCESLKTRAPCRLLAHAALAMIESFLPDVIESDAFLSLPLPLLARILLRQRQTEGCEAALQAWVAHDARTRQEQLQVIRQSCSLYQSLPPASDYHMDVEQPLDLAWIRPTDVPLKTPVMVAIGGFNGPSTLRSVEQLDFHTNEWFSVASMHERRSYSGVVVTDDDKIVVLGGSCNSRHLKAVEQYDPETNTWEMLPLMRKGRSYLGAALLDGYIYVVGGFNGMTHLATVERFSLRTHGWEEVAPLQTGRSGLAVAVAHGKLYAIGGYDGRRHLKSVEVYDPRRNQWLPLSSTMRHARNGPAAVPLLRDNSILVFGGESRHALRMNTSERLDLATMEWEDVDPFVDCRSGHVAVAMLRDSVVFAIGGSNKKDEYLDDVHRFDPLTKQWLPHSRMLHQRCGLNVAVVRVSRDAACLPSRTKEETATATEAVSPNGVDAAAAATFQSLRRSSLTAFSAERAPFA